MDEFVAELKECVREEKARATKGKDGSMVALYGAFSFGDRFVVGMLMMMSLPYFALSPVISGPLPDTHSSHVLQLVLGRLGSVSLLSLSLHCIRFRP